MATLLRHVLGVREMFVDGVRLEDAGMFVRVRPRWRRPRCGGCGKRRPGYDRRTRPRTWRHVAVLATRVYLEYALRRVDCPGCGVQTEAVPWAEPGSFFTRTFEELVAYLARVTDKTAASRIAGIAWASVGSIVERVVARKRDPGWLDGLRRIGIDEFSYRRGQHYLTVVVDHDERRVVWAGEGRGAETLGRFLDELGPEGCARLELATIDMAAAYVKALRERVPHVQVVFDRFHVERLAHEAVDEVRREQQREQRGTPAAQALKRTRFSLLRSPWNLSRSDEEKLAGIQRENAPLYRGYLLKETLAAALEERSPRRAEQSLRDWLAWASRSKLRPFVRVARTVRRHFDGVLAYVRDRFSNGVVEGINNRLRMVARRAFGFHGPGALIAMLFLCCGGIALHPPLPKVTHS